MKFGYIVQKVSEALGKNSATILTVGGIASFVSSIGFSIWATRDAVFVYKAASDEAYFMEGSKTKKAAHVIKRVAPMYIPTVVTAVAGTACILAANRIHLDDKAALVAAYSVGQDALHTYQDNVKKLYSGLDDEKAVYDEIANEDKDILDDLRKDAPGDGEVLVYDHVTGRYFMGDKQKVEHAEATILRRLVDETVVTVNDFYYELGLDDISNVGHALGWDTGRCMPNIHYTSMLDDEGRPCLVINYDVCIVSPRLLEMASNW